MKKLLFIKDGLSIGGTTSSFISLMNLLCKQEEFSVEVWVNNINRNNLLLPSNLSVIESEELEIAFRRPTSKFGKLLDMVRFRQLFLQLKAQKMKKTNYINRELIAIYQEMDINRAKRMKKIDLSSYDVVITWEELFPEYLLAEAVLAKRKIAWIHPDYKQSTLR